jgi:hypothetical protein
MEGKARRPNGRILLIKERYYFPAITAPKLDGATIRF